MWVGVLFVFIEKWLLRDFPETDLELYVLQPSLHYSKSTAQ
jgi:hypothetical protein